MHSSGSRYTEYVNLIIKVHFDVIVYGWREIADGMNAESRKCRGRNEKHFPPLPWIYHGSRRKLFEKFP